MILYVCPTPSFYLDLIAHKNMYHPSEKVVFVAFEGAWVNSGYDKSLLKLEEFGFYHKVYLKPILCDMHKKLNIEDYEKYIIEYYQNLFSDLPCKIEEFKRIYCTNDGWDGAGFNIYFNIMNIEYYWINVC